MAVTKLSNPVTLSDVRAGLLCALRVVRFRTGEASMAARLGLSFSESVVRFTKPLKLTLVRNLLFVKLRDVNLVRPERSSAVSPVLTALMVTSFCIPATSRAFNAMLLLTLTEVTFVSPVVLRDANWRLSSSANVVKAVADDTSSDVN